MKILASVIALAAVLAWPASGEAQNRKSEVRNVAPGAQQGFVPGRSKAEEARRGNRPCAGYAWWGCTGWDPDPNIRDMLARDVGDDK